MLNKLLNWLASKSSAYKELEAINKTNINNLERLATGSATLKDLSIENGNMNVTVASEAAGYMASLFMHHLDAIDAPNYIEHQFRESNSAARKAGREDRHIVIVTIQRKNGKSPHEIRKELEAEKEDTKQFVSALAKEYETKWSSTDHQDDYYYYKGAMEACERILNDRY